MSPACIYFSEEFNIWIKPIPACIEVFTGFNPRESFIDCEFIPKLKLEPPIKIIRGDSVIFKASFLSMSANSNEVLDLGVAGNDTINNNGRITPIKVKVISLEINFFNLAG
jgi:hypothetical protein